MADQLFDIAVIGAGPAGLSAALTARVRNKAVALFEHMDFSPQNCKRLMQSTITPACR